MNNLQRTDQLTIYSKTPLSLTDFNVVNLLYQPILGSETTGMYLLFCSLLNRDTLKSSTFIHSNIFDLLSIDIDSFLVYRKKLEGIGLIETYFKNDSYNILLVAPLSPYQFFNDSIFSSFLNEKIGDGLFNCLRDSFEVAKFEKKSFKKITETFENVFKSIKVEEKEIKENLIDQIRASIVKVKANKFDYNEFLKQIDQNKIENNFISKFEKLIREQFFLYGLTLEEMISIYDKSENQLGMFNPTLFKTNIKKYFELKNNNSKIGLSVEDGISDWKYETEFQTFISLDTRTLIQHYYQDLLESSSWNKIVTLKETLGISHGLFNILLIDVLNTLKGELPSINYFKKVLNTYNEKGLEDERNAFVYFLTKNNQDSKSGSSINKTTYNKKPRRVKRSKEVDEMIKEYEENLMEGVNFI
ncbi:MAG: hypothetical protein ACRC5M_06245 [Anaeroplasmataceae bacterium]